LSSGNKCDLEQLREVRKEEAAALAKQYNMIDALETSAKDNTNVDEAFLKIAKVIKKNFQIKI
jgi:Ras-related protein Rab-43